MKKSNFSETKALKEILATLKKKTLAPGRKKGGRSPYRIANDHGFPRAHLSDWLNERERKVTEEMKKRIVAAIYQEAREAGVDFPVERFKEYLSHGRKVA